MVKTHATMGRDQEPIQSPTPTAHVMAYKQGKGHGVDETELQSQLERESRELLVSLLEKCLLR